MSSKPLAPDSDVDNSLRPIPPGRWEHVEAVIEQLLILFALYVLSIGPMYWRWFSAKYVNGPALLAAFYEPLWILAGWCPPLGAWINWYVRFWVF